MKKLNGSFFSRFFSRFFDAEISRRVDLAVRVLDDSRDRMISGRVGHGSGQDTFPRDRHGYDRDEVFADALDAWRVNPLARRIVELTSQYVVGGGLSVESPHEGTDRFLGEWWNHRLNRMSTRCFDWCDELSRTGNLFVVVSTDPGGMSYLRAIPAVDILEIETAPNDCEQELFVIEKPDLGTGLEGRRWKVYDESGDERTESGEFEPVILHYAVNKPVGGKWGESDLGPLLRWLSRYAAWLEDRARLNRYRNTFLFWVKAQFSSNAERQARQAELNANPPNPGSTLVTDMTEEWSCLTPNLASFEAAEDGQALKKMIAAGSGNPMHFLAEPEGATRTTAEAAGGPTFRHYEQRQLYFLWMLKDLGRVAIARRAELDRHISRRAEIIVKGTDISARDNASLGTAATTIIAAFAELRDRGLIDDNEFLRLAYRFAGEGEVDIEDMLKRGAAAGPVKNVNPAKASGKEQGANGRPAPAKTEIKPAGVKIKPVEVDPITGEPTKE